MNDFRYTVYLPWIRIRQTLGLIGCPSSHFQYLRALGTYCPRSCIFYKLRQDSDTQCVHCPLYHNHIVGILAVLCVQVHINELRLVWPVNSPRASLSLNLLIVKRSLILPGRGYLLISALYYRQLTSTDTSFPIISWWVFLPALKST